ncbi:MAG: DUF1846 domain-containing protein [Methanomassiliicoccaceae archaeon]|jgi:uncharacterized protein (UPF0371 family)|nr:DUF1846 domain-containing protein [Methanomassiliicoccaceae archaeon]
MQSVKNGFDNDKYLLLQSENIRERISKFGGKLYLEFGGKIFDDFHASRVLPGFEPDSKVRMLTQLKDQAEIVIVINSGDIEKNKVRGDTGVTYDLEALKMIDTLRGRGFLVSGVVLTQYNSQHAADKFRDRLIALGMKVYKHYLIAGYPSNIPHIVSENGFGKNDHVITERSLVVITGPGSGSGKMATCLSQLYHDHKNGIKAGYAKYETFPMWDLSLKHPVNLAYEAATADLNDVNMIDPFHLEAYGKSATSYNRDIAIFPVLCAMMEKISGTPPYKSPTDMGVNKAGKCIVDENVVKQASRQEIIRRYYAAKCAVKEGFGSEGPVLKLEILMKKAGVSTDDRKVAVQVMRMAADTGRAVVGIELHDGRIVTGKSSPLMCSSAAMLLNTLKTIAKLDDSIPLISPSVIEPVREMKTKYMGNTSPRLHADEILVALSVSAAMSPAADVAFKRLPDIRGCEAHSSVILASVDEQVFRKLGVNITCEPQYQTADLYQGFR